MRFKRIIVVFSIFTVGLLLGAGGGIAYSGWLMANTLLMLKRTELCKSSEIAFGAYKSQTPETGAWALEQHLKLVENDRELGIPKYELDCGAFLAHARLAKLFDSLGKRNETKDHVRCALDLAGPAGFPAISSEQALWDELRTFDDRAIY
jgi:hypothetical protein